MARPVLASSDTWFAQGGTSVKRSSITQINICDSYQPSADAISWDASASKDGSVMVYVEGTVLTIAGNGSGKIATSADASCLFSDHTKADYFSSLISINGADLLDTANATTLERVFDNCYALTYVDVSNWDTSRATSLKCICQRCEALPNIDVSRWDTRNVTDMLGAFNKAHSLTYLDASKWDVSNVTTMNNLFSGCYSLASIVGVGAWRTANATIMDKMFAGCIALKSLELSGWDVGNVTSINYMFAGINEIEPMSIETINVSGWDVSNVAGMHSVFMNCSYLTELDLTSWDVSNAEDMEFILANCHRLRKITVGDKFAFKGDTATYAKGLPVPNSEFIDGADGYWYTFVGKQYSPESLPNNVANTYYASILDIKDVPVVVKNGVLIDTVKAIRAKTGIKDGLTPSEFDDAIYSPTLSSSFLSCVTQDMVTELHFAATYVADGTERYVWAADSMKSGSIMGYQKGSVVTIAPTQGGKIYLDANSSNLFAGLNFLKTITGWENVDASRVRLFDGGFARCGCLEALDLSALTFTSLEGYERLLMGCYRLKSVVLWQGVTSVAQAMFHTNIALETISGLSNVTDIGARAFIYTTKLRSVDIDPQKIAHIGEAACRMSSIEDLVDFSSVPLEQIESQATRRKRWDTGDLASIQSFFSTGQYEQVYLETPNTENQCNYPDIPFYIQNGETFYVARSGCGYVATYHEWNAVYKRYDATRVYPDFITWWNEVILTNDDGTPYDFVGSTPAYGDVDRIRALRDRLGWSSDDFRYVASVEQMRLIAQRLTEGFPVYGGIYSTTMSGGTHAVTIIGMNPSAGKLAVLDPHVAGNTGIVSWIAFEDLFTKGDLTTGEEDGWDSLKIVLDYNLKE